MPLSDKEQLLLEEVKTLLGDKNQLGLKIHEKGIQDRSNTYQWLHENIDQQFDLDILDLTHHQGISAAFKKVHDYKPLDSQTFFASFRREMTAQGIPNDEIDKALKIADKLMAKVDSKKGQNEKDSGWHPELDEVMATAHPES